MIALSHCLGSLALLLTGAEEARISRKRDSSPLSTKFIAGVPVVNCDTTKTSLAELEDAEQEWVMMLRLGTSADGRPMHPLRSPLTPRNLVPLPRLITTQDP